MGDAGNYFRVPERMTLLKVLIDLGVLPNTTREERSLASNSLDSLKRQALVGYVSLSQPAEACEQFRIYHNLPQPHFVIAKGGPGTLEIKVYNRGTTHVERVGFQPSPSGLGKVLQQVIDTYTPLNIGIGTDHRLLAATNESFRVTSNRGAADYVQSQGPMNCGFAGSFRECIERARNYPAYFMSGK